MQGMIEVSDSRREMIALRQILILPESPMLDSVRLPKGRSNLFDHRSGLQMGHIITEPDVCLPIGHFDRFKLPDGAFPQNPLGMPGFFGFRRQSLTVYLQKLLIL